MGRIMFGIKWLKKWWAVEHSNMYDYYRGVLERLEGAEEDVALMQGELDLADNRITELEMRVSNLTNALTDQVNIERHHRQEALEAVCRHLDVRLKYDGIAGEYSVVLGNLTNNANKRFESISKRIAKKLKVTK